MKLTLDRMCIQSGKLCVSCEKLLQNGTIGEVDIAFGKALMNTAKSQKFLSNITVKKIIETKNTIFVVTNLEDKKKIEQAKVQITNIMKTTDNRDIIALEKTKSPKKFIEGLIGSEMLVSTSTVFLPPFSEKELKVQIKKTNERKLKILSEDLSKLTKAILGMDAHYSFI